ncbi:MAG: hypothetical protein ACI4XC_09315, partial [Eubacterium sp.]
MKKLLSTMLAFVMLATTLMTVPFTAQADTAGSLDIQLASTASLKTGTSVSASLNDTFTLSAQGNTFDISIGNYGSNKSYWKGYYADTEYTEAFTLVTGIRYKLQIILVRGEYSANTPAELRFRGTKIASLDDKGVPSAVNSSVNVSQLSLNVWKVNLTMEELIINNQKGEFVPTGLPQTVTADPAPEGKHFAGWTGTYHTGSGSKAVTFGDANAMQTTFTMPSTDAYVSVNSNYADHSFTEIITPERKATCLSSGKTAEMGCSGCDATLPSTEIPPTGHTEVSADNAVAPRCTIAGRESDTVCATCGTIIKTGATIPATGHDFGTNNESCSRCGATNPNYVAPVPTPTPAPTTTAMPKSVKNGGVTYTKNSAGEYVGSKAKKSSVKKLAKGKKAFTVTYSKVSGVTGYEVQYSTSKKFTKKTTKKATFKGNKKFTQTVKKLSGNKKYYVRVRTYKTVKVNG